MSYPVTFEADYVERRNRLTAFFRLILAIPLFIWLYIYAIVAVVAILIAWFKNMAHFLALQSRSPVARASIRASSVVQVALEK